MRIAYLYTPSELTPWKENVNKETLQHLQDKTPEKYETEIVCFTGFNEEMKSKLFTFDIVFNLCYGYHNSGQVEVAQWLENLGILHTASSFESMLLAQDKAILPRICSQLKLYTPEIFYECHLLDNERFYIAKPRKGSCHRDITIADGAWMKKFLDTEDKDLIIQPYMIGREFSVAVIPSQRGNYHYALPPIEIIPEEDTDIFIAGQSYGKTKRILNPLLFQNKIEELMLIAEKLHDFMGLKGMSRTDFRMTSDDKIYVLDVNAMPNLDPVKSLMPALCIHHGIDMENLISRILQNTLFHTHKDYSEKVAL